MIPVNQVILGGDPLLGGSVIGNSLDEQLQLLERYKQNLEAAKQMKQQIQPVSQSVPAQKLIWDDIDAEVEPMTEEQKSRLFQDDDYYDDFYMKGHEKYPNDFDRMFHSDNRGQHKFFDRFNRMSEGMNEEDMYEMMKAMKSHYSGDEHFNESYARYLVSNMHHTENGRKYVGEKFDMTKAKEVCERYRGILAQSITHADVYVAINSHYHDYCELFKAWFGDNIDQKIIESAIIFWFKDDDYEEGSKLWNYFKEN